VVLLTGARRSFLLSGSVYRSSRVYICYLRQRMLREGVVTKEEGRLKCGISIVMLGVKRLESEGLESGLKTGCSSSRINIRISIDRLSGRLIEVALFL
jgi:hypothetical protein